MIAALMDDSEAVCLLRIVSPDLTLSEYVLVCRTGRQLASVGRVAAVATAPAAAYGAPSGEIHAGFLQLNLLFFTLSHLLLMDTYLVIMLTWFFLVSLGAHVYALIQPSSPSCLQQAGVGRLYPHNDAPCNSSNRLQLNCKRSRRMTWPAMTYGWHGSTSSRWTQMKV